MAGSAQLGTNLVDSLVGLADNLRGSLNSAFGVRQWHVFAVRREWSGGERGAGTVRVSERVQLTPDPEVLFDSGRAFMYEMRAHGRDSVGDAMLREVSLTYSEAQLTGGTIEPHEEFFFKLEDAHGQAHAPRFFVPKRPPIADRDKRIGWQIDLDAVEIKSPEIS